MVKTARTAETGLINKTSSGSILTTTIFTNVPVSSVTGTTPISLVTNRNLVHVTNSSGPHKNNDIVPPPNYNVMDVGNGDVKLITRKYNNGKMRRNIHSAHSMGYGYGDGVKDNGDNGVRHGYKRIAPRSTTASGYEEYEDYNDSEYKYKDNYDMSKYFEHQSHESAESSSSFGRNRSAYGVEMTTRRSNRLSPGPSSAPVCKCCIVHCVVL